MFGIDLTMTKWPVFGSQTQKRFDRKQFRQTRSESYNFAHTESRHWDSKDWLSICVIDQASPEANVEIRDSNAGYPHET